MIRIEVQDQFGQWHRYTKVAEASTVLMANAVIHGYI